MWHQLQPNLATASRSFSIQILLSLSKELYVCWLLYQDEILQFVSFDERYVYEWDFLHSHSHTTRKKWWYQCAGMPQHIYLTSTMSPVFISPFGLYHLVYYYFHQSALIFATCAEH